jgi:hypothetical protein
MNFTCKIQLSIILIFFLKIRDFFFFLVMLYISVEKLSFHFLSPQLSIRSWIRSFLLILIVGLLRLLIILFFHSLFFHLLVHFESFRIGIIEDTSHICFIVVTCVIKSISTWCLNIMWILGCLNSTAIVWNLNFSWSSHFEINWTLNSSMPPLWFFLLWIICKNRILCDCFCLCSWLRFAFI